jgi:hypothetical protein
LSLEYEAGVFRNRTGATVIVRDDLSSSTYGAHYLAHALVKAGLDYSVGRNLLNVAYDWRLSPNLDFVFLEKMRSAVETAFATSDQQRVFVTGHSTGGSQALYFLNSVSAEWKQQFVAGYISFSANLGGLFFEIFAVRIRFVLFIFCVV